MCELFNDYGMNYFEMIEIREEEIPEGVTHIIGTL